jgi:hypothetical protein
VIDNQIDIVFYLINDMNSDDQIHFIDALAELKKKAGKEAHFLHTSGAKLFSSHAGAPTVSPLLDTDPKLYDL